jgi:hypothetical protein
VQEGANWPQRQVMAWVFVLRRAQALREGIAIQLLAEIRQLAVASIHQETLGQLWARRIDLTRVEGTPRERTSVSVYGQETCS